MSALRMFIPITKVDAAQRLVYGVATAEAEDRAGEICDYESTKPFYEKWSADIAKSTGGRSCGNLRAMHGAVAAGKVTALTFNDDAKQIEICAKVVDAAEWAKVEEGVYTGFSQGGSYVRRWTDEDGRARYTADPSEVSLVDLPCLKEASFELIKRDGSRELRPFAKNFDNSARLSSLMQELDWLRGSAIIAAAMAPDAADMLTELQAMIVRTACLLRSVVDAETAPLLTDAGTMPAKAAAVHNLQKRGARNSAADLERIQGMHDASVELGATCSAAKAAHGQNLDKRFDTLATTLTDVLERVKRIEAQPLPLPLTGRTRMIAKGQDSGADDPGLDALLADPDALSLLAIKLAQRNGRRFLRP